MKQLQNNERLGWIDRQQPNNQIATCRDGHLETITLHYISTSTSECCQALLPAVKHPARCTSPHHVRCNPRQSSSNGLSGRGARIELQNIRTDTGLKTSACHANAKCFHVNCGVPSPLFCYEAERGSLSLRNSLAGYLLHWKQWGTWNIRPAVP